MGKCRLVGYHDGNVVNVRMKEMATFQLGDGILEILAVSEGPPVTHRKAINSAANPALDFSALPADPR